MIGANGGNSVIREFPYFIFMYMHLFLCVEGGVYMRVYVCVCVCVYMCMCMFMHGLVHLCHLFLCVFLYVCVCLRARLLWVGWGRRGQGKGVRVG